MNPRSHLRRVLAATRYLPRTLRLAQEAAGRWTLVWAMLLLAQGLLPALILYLTKHVVDGLVAALSAGTGWSGAVPVFVPAAFMGLVTLAALLLGVTARWIQERQAGLLQDHISGLIHARSAVVRMQFYDFPEFFDHLHRARQEAGYRPAQLLGALGALFQSGTTVCAVAAALTLHGGWVLPVVLLLSTAPSLWSTIANSLRRQQWQHGATKVERWARYYDYLLTEREPAAEMRAFHLTARFSQAFQALRSRLRRERLELLRWEGVRELLGLLVGLGVVGVAAAWVMNEALNGGVTAGTLAMFYAAFVQGQGAMRSALANVAKLFTNSLFLGHLFAFLDLETETTSSGTDADAGGGESSLTEGIHFESVDFSYPGSSRATLSDLTLTIPAGKTVAIVGPNGAGKSTLFKLLCRFYEPQTGHILIDGQNIAERTPFEIRRTISVLFQDPVRYSATVEESVALGDATPHPSPIRIRGAVAAGGAEAVVERLAQGYDTLLGKEFENGAELSGGEWQRIALARALIRPAPILLLDEPTSAMDSWAEAEWYDRLREATVGRTTIIITHRFTTAMRADVIHVMDKGRIVESGSHDELVAAGGSYAISWARQTRESTLVQAG